MTKLEVFWDAASPYTFLAVTQIPSLAERTGAEVVYRPFLLGGVFKATGNQMPGAVAAKGAYMMNDLERWAQHYGVAMKKPGEVPFPINTVAPMRVAVAAGRHGKAAEIATAMTKIYWADGRNISEPEVLADVAASIGLDAAAIATEIQDQTVKDELRANTEEAVARGAFGAPTMFVNDQMFWGNDRLDHVEAALRG